MSVPRFYAPDANAIGDAVALPEDEATHLTRVLRMTAGSMARVFNGRGDEWDAEIVDANKQRVTVRLGVAVAPAAESALSITLAMAVLKGDKMDDVVRDAVMMGVTAIRPLVTERAEVTLAVVARGGRVARWQRVAVSSAKQCGRAVVPPIFEPVSLAGSLDESSAASRLMLIEPARRADTVPLRGLPPSNQVELIVGPEGGWTDGEVTAAVEAGASLVTLGGHTLRADAAPIVAISAVRVLWDDL